MCPTFSDMVREGLDTRAGGQDRRSTNISTSSTAPVDESRWRTIWHRWPSVLWPRGRSPATGDRRGSGHGRDRPLRVALLCYLGAAALARPWIAWAGIIGGSLVVFASELVGLVWWTGIGVAALALLVAGLLGRASRPALTAQTVALLGYGGLAVAALYFAPRLGLALAGVALASHAVWDLIHYRRNQVVPRSLAEFCMLLDVPLGVGALTLAIID